VLGVRAVIGRQQIGAVLGDGGVVIGHDGVDLGRIVRVFLDALSSEPAWMTVTGEQWDGEEPVVPLALAELDRGRVAVPYSVAVVRNAPRADTSDGSLHRRYETDLVRHYGLDGNGEVSHGPEERAWRLPRTDTSVRALRAELRDFLEVSGLPAEEVDGLVLATSEAATNAVEYSGSLFATYFDVVAEVSGSEISISVRDYGRWRDPRPGSGRGRGLLLMSRLATLTVTVEPQGTTVTLRNRSSATGQWSFRRRR
jgi:anti-sigma regulatory factor (Ser/Thr protein kinase)